VGRFEEVRGSEAFRVELGIRNQNLIVGTVGRLSVEKGHEHLLEAMRKVFRVQRSVSLLVVGDGPLRGELEKKAEYLNGQVVFAGIREDMPCIYSAMDVFVLPSRKEGMPLVLLEAMASGKPVMATRVGDVPRVVEDGVSGLLVESEDVEGMASAILSLLGDGPLRQGLGERARETVRGRYSSKAMAEEYRKVYMEALEQGHRRKGRGHRVGVTRG